MPNPGEKDPTELKEPTVIFPERPEVPVAEPDVFRPEQRARRVYIRIADLDKYGYTLGCEVCDAMRAGQRRVPGTHHSQECRDRIQKCMLDDDVPNERLTKAFVKREAEQDAERARADKAPRSRPE